MGEAKRKAQARAAAGGDAMSHADERYWIAINGPTCAMTSLPLRKPQVTTTPQQLVGFPTWEEAEHAQSVCLNAPMAEVASFS
jgi:hypothetical protein